MTIEQAERARAILIMEDEAFIRYDLVDFFEDRGFEAENADQAMRCWKRTPRSGSC
ncbi:hypothetical protein Q4610_17375 [Sphingobium sp. HBC34]|uniref:Response regulatory domain-containing protein n=1 Tax=Sphingobium cyanobacteriorum TaxID=3063954 RepID=A0ABT8ZQJ3_9SPHN|nr:hypothetical protein [Sphingobium sp. HBC34]MDO7836820.1 hypothetical protein [Sphingobium sp. HBC34]